MSTLLKRKNELLCADAAISPRSGSLIKVEQAMDKAARFRLTLTVTYSDNYAGLHLCKATGTYELVSPGGGIRALSTNLYWNAVGQKYVNGVHEKILRWVMLKTLPEQYLSTNN